MLPRYPLTRLYESYFGSNKVSYTPWVSWFKKFLPKLKNSPGSLGATWCGVEWRYDWLTDQLFLILSRVGESHGYLHIPCHWCWDMEYGDDVCGSSVGIGCWYVAWYVVVVVRGVCFFCEVANNWLCVSALHTTWKFLVFMSFRFILNSLNWARTPLFTLLLLLLILLFVFVNLLVLSAFLICCFCLRIVAVDNRSSTVIAGVQKSHWHG